MKCWEVLRWLFLNLSLLRRKRGDTLWPEGERVRLSCCLGNRGSWGWSWGYIKNYEGGVGVNGPNFMNYLQFWQQDVLLWRWMENYVGLTPRLGIRKGTRSYRLMFAICSLSWKAETQTIKNPTLAFIQDLQVYFSSTLKHELVQQRSIKRSQKRLITCVGFIFEYRERHYTLWNWNCCRS